MLNLAELDDRIVKCERILSENPNSQIFAALADAHRRKGQLDKALEVCRSGLKLHPNYGSAHLVMAKVHMDRQMYELAEKALEEAIRLEGRTRATELLLCEIFIHKKKLPEALSILEKLHITDPENQEVKYLLELCRKETGKIRPSAEITRPSFSAPARPGQKRGDSDIFTLEAERAQDSVIGPEEALDELFAIPEVDALMVVNREGLIIDKRFRGSWDADSLAAISASVFTVAEDNLEKVDLGQLEKVWIDTDGVSFLAVRMEEKVLMVVYRPDINLGAFKMKVGAFLDYALLAG
ncbi:MAG TPA: tetratricopeptide repeat protein [candidate division Zixibacteria bacterium]|nr:tetratricopeptide repeat protein [candidate division Zixibacteria bacterium]